ncbi:DUF2637 domain-containing protein [Amycolatopsis sp. NPDC051758]|uniref:DUF2637 domain-containing protein n=1 Tax=Amycolatopsis sp. NPDC051758 TaxID=3363935 RepID=UPI0037B77CF7
MVMLLVAMAAATAWYGQYRYLREAQALGVVFSAAGATALELFGLSMFANARQLGKLRDRAIRVRGFGWAVIVFSAYSNWVHNGLVLAAMSVAGPVAWEVHEWTQQRVRLHQLGKLTPRPVRPRFPIDQVLLFPLWSMHAYRCAVRDRIETAGEALAVARRDRHAKVAGLRVGSRSWRRTVRRSIDRHRKASANAGAQPGVVDRPVGCRDRRSVDARRPIADLNPLNGASVGSRSRAGKSMPTKRFGGSTWSWLRRGKQIGIGSSDAKGGSKQSRSRRPVQSMLGSSIDVGRSEAAPVSSQLTPDFNQKADSIGLTRNSIASHPADDSRSSRREAPRAVDQRSESSKRSVDHVGDRRVLSIPELLPLARQVASEKGWMTGEDVKAEPLRVALRISPKRSRILRSELKKEMGTQENRLDGVLVSSKDPREPDSAPG